jgi:hypothetical protein
MIWYLACSLAVTLLPVQVSSSAAPLVMLTDPTAKCLDGTAAGFYVQQAKNSSNINQWVLYLEGGGECDTESACQAQTYSSLGSSKYFAPTSDSSGWYLASDYCPYNPDLCGWNHARDPYCTQDLHSGQVENPDDSTWGLYFSGHLVFKAMLDALDQPPYNLVDATDIILSGTSAGIECYCILFRLFALILAECFRRYWCVDELGLFGGEISQRPRHRRHHRRPLLLRHIL